MSARLAFLIGALALQPIATAAEKEAAGRYLAKPLRGDYYVYGGSIGDSTPPTEKDRKLSLMFTGALAKDTFDRIGPDLRDACGAGPDSRQRRRGDLICVWTKGDGYSCYFGIDVMTGKGMRGTTC
ncbi:hypothetical protein [Massilia sp. Root335]|uniref:hypothetical protein n=1 Tax=Massilia sp. Root335 TaxID=1736517 RepID=UPI0006FA45BC|nr:hypothetical protein [Massilia sp. Root335]KQV27019.1 hypothetical protein ASC93_28980 [Massilia sp. Root335]